MRDVNSDFGPRCRGRTTAMRSQSCLAVVGRTTIASFGVDGQTTGRRGAAQETDLMCLPQLTKSSGPGRRRIEGAGLSRCGHVGLMAARNRARMARPKP